MWYDGNDDDKGCDEIHENHRDLGDEGRAHEVFEPSLYCRYINSQIALLSW